jgi:hypothetical protein
LWLVAGVGVLPLITQAINEQVVVVLADLEQELVLSILPQLIQLQ